jgi:hypothetical protein
MSESAKRRAKQRAKKELGGDAHEADGGAAAPAAAAAAAASPVTAAPPATAAAPAPAPAPCEPEDPQKELKRLQKRLKQVGWHWHQHGLCNARAGAKRATHPFLIAARFTELASA